MIRPAMPGDRPAIGRIFGPVVRAGETYALPRDFTDDDAADYWLAPGHMVFVAEGEHSILGSYYLRANQRGGGRHVANAGFVTASAAAGHGVARRMGEHALQQARVRGFKAMQFNFVVASNERAVKLWQSLGFEIVGRLPKAFVHPALGEVDALVMFRTL